MKYLFYSLVFLFSFVTARQTVAQNVDPVLQLDGSILFQVGHIILNPEGKIAYLDLIEAIPITVSLDNEPIVLLEEQRSFLKIREKLPQSLWNHFKWNANGKISLFNDHTIEYNFNNLIDYIGTSPIEYNFKNKIDKIGNYEIAYNFKGKIEQIGNIAIEYNFQNRIDKIGNQNISYNFRNQIDRIGDIDIEYDLHNRVENIGKLHIDYNLSNRIDQVGDLAIEYDARGKIYKIGHHKFTDNVYSSAVNHNPGF